MSFCEECGAKLSSNVRFCEECGTPVTVYEQNIDAAKDTDVSLLLTLFQNSNWADIFSSIISNSDDETGLILTNLQLLARELNVDQALLLNLVEEFISEKKQVGITYFLLDVSNNVVGKAKDVDSHVKLLQKIAKIECPFYLFILGGNNIIPTKIYEDKTGHDRDIASDLPYATLDTDSPWRRKKYNFENCMTVGRLPTFANESFEEFKIYFENLKINLGNLNEIGISAKEWENTSNFWFNKISNKTVLTSPQLEKSNIHTCFDINKNLFYFNLHGAEDTDVCEWYGQENTYYPSVISPNDFIKNEKPYIVGVEACYGARYINYKKNKSILLTAISTKCLSFLGSSRIAYGACFGEGSCADIIIGTYLKNVKDGYSCGKSFTLARKELTKQRNLDIVEIKTLLEFSLYGDPSYKCTQNSSKSFIQEKSIKSFHISLPDVLTEVRMEIAKVDEEIMSLVNKSVYTNYPEFNSVNPEILKDTSVDCFSATYKTKISNLNHILTAYFDKEGKITKEYISK